MNVQGKVQVKVQLLDPRSGLFLAGRGPGRHVLLQGQVLVQVQVRVQGLKQIKGLYQEQAPYGQVGIC